MRTGKSFTFSISNNDMNDVIKIIKSLKDSGVLMVELLKQNNIKLKSKKGISWSFVSTFSHFISATSKFFSSKIYKARRS